MESNDFSKTVAPHFVNGRSLLPPYPEHTELAMFGMGCFWGAEKRYWQCPGVEITAVGYSAGHQAYPSYEQVCHGQTGHAEVVLVVFDPDKVSYSSLLELFWNNHNPTQGNRQGNDIGTQYRSGIYVYTDQQKTLAEQSRQQVQAILDQSGHGPITTEILPAQEFYIAEPYHQQYLAKNPHGYCGLGGLDLDIQLEYMA